MSLEPEFWDAFCQIAKEECKPINALAAEIDVSREADVGLASAIRVYVLRSLMER